METNYKKGFLISMITSLCAGALTAIGIIVFGDFGELEIKVLLTTVAVGGFSLTALCNSALYDKKKCVEFAIFGIVISVLGFLVTMILIWSGDAVDSEAFVKLMFVLMILSVSTAHISVLLIMNSMSKIVNFSLYATMIFILWVVVMLVILVITEGEPGIDPEVYYRVLGVFAILDVLGTIVTPIMNKFFSRPLERHKT